MTVTPAAMRPLRDSSAYYAIRAVMFEFWKLYAIAVRRIPKKNIAGSAVFILKTNFAFFWYFL